MAVPTDIPVTTPVAGTTGATTMYEELHVPPAIESLSGTEFPIHKNDAPVMDDGNGFTVIVAPVAHPVVRV